MGDSSSSELLDLSSSTSALCFVRSSLRHRCSGLADLGVGRSAGTCPVPIVGVVSASGPPSAQFHRLANSSVLRTGIGSCSRGSGQVIGGVTKLAARVVLGPAPGIPVHSGCSPVGLRRSRNSLRVFSIFWL